MKSVKYNYQDKRHEQYLSYGGRPPKEVINHEARIKALESYYQYNIDLLAEYGCHPDIINCDDADKLIARGKANKELFCMGCFQIKKEKDFPDKKHILFKQCALCKAENNIVRRPTV